MRHANAQALFDYWQSLRGEGQAPRQRALHPAQIKGALPNLFVLQRYDADHYVFRLAGTGYCALFGREFRSQNILGQLGGPARRYFSVLLDRVIAVPCGGLAEARAHTLNGQYCTLEYLLLPLADPDGRITRILGTVNVTDWGTSSVFDRFANQTLLSLQAFDPDEPPAGRFRPKANAARLSFPLVGAEVTAG